MQRPHNIISRVDVILCEVVGLWISVLVSWRVCEGVSLVHMCQKVSSEERTLHLLSMEVIMITCHQHGRDMLMRLLMWSMNKSFEFCVWSIYNWPRGVTVSTLDSESSDRGSNPREVFSCWVGVFHFYADFSVVENANRGCFCKMNGSSSEVIR